MTNFKIQPDSHQHHYGKTYVCLSCVKFFAVPFISGARQRDCLPCVFYKAHGKQALCRALEKTHDKDLVCRAFYFLAHVKDFSPTGR
jgi:hypothetical protein